MTGPQDTYNALHAQLGGDALVTQGTADSWLGLYTSLNELAAALNSHQVALLSDSGWSGPAAEQFQAYMTAMTQQVKGAADSAAAISVQLQDAAGTLHSAQQAVITAEQQPGPPGETPDQRAQRLTPIAQEQVQTVSDAYGRASQTLAQAQAVAPTPTVTSEPHRNVPSDPTSGADGAAHGSVPGRNGTSPSGGTYATASDGSTGSPRSTLRNNASAGSTATNAGVPEDGVVGASVSTAGLGDGTETGVSGSSSPNDGRSGDPGAKDGLPAGWWPGNGTGTSGPGEPGIASDPLRRGSVPGGTPSGSSASDGSPAYGDGSEGIHGGVRQPSSLPGRPFGQRSGRPIGEVEPGIIGGEPVGGGRVISGRGLGVGPSGAREVGGGVDEGISGGRLEASPAQGMRRGPWPRSAMAPEGEAAGMEGGMPMGGLGAGAGQEKERGKRPKYLKQDPEYWQPKQAVVPPVIE